MNRIKDFSNLIQNTIILVLKSIMAHNHLTEAGNLTMEMGEIRKATSILPPLLYILFSGRGTALNSPASYFLGS